MSLRELQQVLPTPATPLLVPTVEEIATAEESIGLQLPEDYKAYLRAYGNGKIDDFMWIFVPGTPNPHANLVACWKVQQEVFEALQRDADPLQYDIHPAKPGLLPIGRTDNGDTIFYLCEGSPEAWRIAVLPSRDDEFRVFDLGLTSFLTALLRHELDVLPSNLRGEFLPISD